MVDDEVLAMIFDDSSLAATLGSGGGAGGVIIEFTFRNLFSSKSGNSLVRNPSSLRKIFFNRTTVRRNRSFSRKHLL